MTTDYCNKNFIAIEFCCNKIFFLLLKILYCNKKYCCYNLMRLSFIVYPLQNVCVLKKQSLYSFLFLDWSSAYLCRVNHNKIDLIATMMTVEEKPVVTYNDVGGCKEQIENMREVSISNYHMSLQGNSLIATKFLLQ